MHTAKQGLLAAIFAFSAVIATAMPGQAFQNVDFSNVAFAKVSGPTSIPIGHAEFCKTHRDECTMNARVVDAATLDEARWNQLLMVNAEVNTTVAPVSDQDLYQVSEFWTYPRQYGDCEDFVLAKRRALIDLGWDASTLLIAVVRQENGEGHAVLMVRTDRGDLVLDNQHGEIRLWTDTPYLFLKRQSQANAGTWVDIADDRSVTTVAATR